MRLRARARGERFDDITRIKLDGEWLYPVVRREDPALIVGRRPLASLLLRQEELVALAAVRAPSVGVSVRRFRCVIVDEGVVRFAPGSGQAVRMDDGHRFRFAAGGMIPVAFQRSRVVIGVIEGISPREPGATPGTEGRHVVAVARLHDSPLADLAWQAIQDRIFDAVCVGIADKEEDPETGELIGGEFIYVQLLEAGAACLASARVLEAWESPA